MAKTKKPKKQRISRDQLVLWLSNNRPLWKSWPMTKKLTDDRLHPWPDNMANEAKAICKACVNGLKADGLVAPSTSWRDVNIGRYIKEIKV